MLYLRGLGQDASVLDHALVPETASARSVYLRLVDSRAEARNYAINAFHESVIRGTAGGCKDPIWPVGSTTPFANGGLDINATCQYPLNRQDIRDAWAAKAAAYLKAVQAWRAGGTWQQIKAVLIEANALQPSPYALEQVDPPVDPGPPEAPMIVIEPVAAGPKPARWKLWVAGGLLAATVGGFIAVQHVRKRKRYRYA